MRPRDVLADNLRKLMAARPELSRFPDITQASRGELTNGTLDRIRRAEVAITVDKLADLAEVFGLEPWQLLVQGLNPEALPRLADVGFLMEIRQIVGSVQPAESRKVTDETPTHQLKPLVPPAVGPVLEKAFDVKRIAKAARRQSGGVQKSRNDRSDKGPSRLGRKGRGTGT